MRFAIKTRPEHQTWEELRDIWVAADEVPLFESIWNWDHFYPLTGDLHGPNFEGWTMLSAMAALTSRIRIGCQVTAMPYRHPAVLANMAATVDHISSGRLILGIGAAWNEMECNAYGFPLPPLKERFDRFDEGIEVLTLLLSQEVANYSGQYFTLTDAHCEPKPIQRPYPPITIGGTGPKRTLRAAARWASEWNGSVQEPARFAELKGILAGHCADIGRDPAEITCSCLIRGDTSDLSALVASLEQWRDAGADLAVIGLPTHAKPESLFPLAEALAALA
jgi:F420-dependent oxidoreductase-like protein